MRNYYYSLSYTINLFNAFTRPFSNKIQIKFVYTRLAEISCELIHSMYLNRKKSEILLYKFKNLKKSDQIAIYILFLYRNRIANFT